MTDIFDHASELENHYRETAISACRNIWSTATYSHCEDCGEPISEARRRAISGCHRCVTCQEWYEKEHGQS